MKQVDKDRGISTSFAKGLAVLEAFDAQAPQLSMAEIARRTGQDRATARRGALTLEALGYLQRKGRLFALSPKLVALSGRFLQAKQIRAQVQPALDHCATDLKQPIYLVANLDDKALILARSATSCTNSQAEWEVGSELDLFQAAFGRMLLAGFTENRLKELFTNTPPERRTDASVTDVKTLHDHIQQAQQQGFVTENGAQEAGTTTFAVPIASEAALVLGSSSAHPHLTATQVDLIREKLQNCATELARLSSIRDF